MDGVPHPAADLQKTWQKLVQWEAIWLKLHSTQEHTHDSRNVEGKNNTSVVFP